MPARLLLVLLLSVLALPSFATSDLLVSVDSRTSTVGQGGSVAYSIAIANYGPDDATNVVMTDVLPAPLVFDSLTVAEGWMCTTPAQGAKGTITCRRDTWPGAAYGVLSSFNLSTRVPFDATGVAVNTVSVTQAGTDPTPGNATASAAPVTIVGTTADVSVTMETTATTAPAGTAFVYDITVRNDGPDTATQVVLTDVLPAPLHFISRFFTTTGSVPPDLQCTFPPVGENGTVQCTAFLMRAGTSATLHLHVGVAAAAEFGTLVNTATLTAATQDPDLSDHSASATVNIGPGADLSLLTTTTATAAETGSTFEYLISLQNHGPNDAANVVVTDVLPRQLVFDRVQAPTMFTCTAPPVGTNGTVTCTAPLFQASRAGGISVRVRVAEGASGTVTNKASVTTSTADMNKSNDTSAATPVIVERRLDPATGTLLPQMTPHVAASADNALAVWREGDVRFTPTGAVASIRGTLFRPGAAGATAVAITDPATTRNVGYPAVAAASDRYLVVWREITSSSARVLARRIRVDGSFIDVTPLVLDSGPETDCCTSLTDPRPAVASDGSAFYVSWVTPAAIRGINVPGEGGVGRAADVISRDTDARERARYDLHIVWTSTLYAVVWMDRLLDLGPTSALAIRYARVTGQGVLLDAQSSPRVNVTSLGSISVAPRRGGGVVVGIDPLQPAIPPPPLSPICPSVLTLSANGDREGSPRTLVCQPFTGYAPSLQSQLVPLSSGYVYTQPGRFEGGTLEETAIRPYAIDASLTTIANASPIAVPALEVAVTNWWGAALFVYSHDVPSGATAIPRLFTDLLVPEPTNNRSRAVRH